MPSLQRELIDWLEHRCIVCGDIEFDKDEYNAGGCTYCNKCSYHCRCTSKDINKQFKKKMLIEKEHWDLIMKHEGWYNWFYGIEKES